MAGPGAPKEPCRVNRSPCVSGRPLWCKRDFEQLAACAQALLKVRPLQCNIHALRARIVFVDLIQTAQAACSTAPRILLVSRPRLSDSSPLCLPSFQPHDPATSAHHSLEAVSAGLPKTKSRLPSHQTNSRDPSLLKGLPGKKTCTGRVMYGRRLADTHMLLPTPRLTPRGVRREVRGERVGRPFLSAGLAPAALAPVGLTHCHFHHLPEPAP